MTVLHCDFETRSELDLKVVGLHNYARHPSTDVWCMAWAIGDEEPRLWQMGDKAPYGEGALKHVRAGGKVVAHNAPFELAIWNNIMVPRYGWPPLKPEQTYCTMAMSYAMALPGALEHAALALGLQILKDTEGRALMLRMARPRSINPDGTPVWWDDADKLARLYAYCQQDVRVERELDKRLLPLSDKERQVWLMDYEINQRGVAVDLETARAALKMADIVKERCGDEIAKITGGAVQSLTALAALKEWIAAQGVDVDSLAKQAVVDLLDTDLPANVRRALTLRQEAGKASTAKLDRILDCAGDDGRLRNLYQYHGAGTGRFAGRGVQVHNLPRDMPSREDVERILALVRAGNYQAIDVIYGPPLTVISKCLRSFFLAPAGKTLISGDWSNVESRGVAWFSGEQWKLDAFREQDAGTGPDVYKLGASRLLKIPVDQITSEQRQGYGKVPDLAFGYGGGVGSGKKMGKTYGVVASDEEWDARKEAWRDSHPNVAGVRMKGMRKNGETFWYRKGGIWKAVEQAAISAVLHPGEKFTCGFPGREATYRVAGSFLWCRLPSGRVNCYPYPKLLQGEYKPVLTYMTVPGPDTEVVHDPQNSGTWARVTTWGGTLFNHIVQGFCRDFLTEGMLAIRDAGGAIVLHTHDDINIETAAMKGPGARTAMQSLMRDPPVWAAGFPLFAKPEIMMRYGK